jgi:hypothetical protein
MRNSASRLAHRLLMQELPQRCTGARAETRTIGPYWRLSKAPFTLGGTQITLTWDSREEEMID